VISLAHLVGAILKDISQARMGSDAYSRDISRYYEQDPLLRGFSVPRADIESVELDLKFAFKSAKLTDARDMDSADRLRSLIDEYKLRTARRAVDLATVELHNLQQEVQDEQRAQQQGAAPGEPAEPVTARKPEPKDSKSQTKLELLLYELQQLKEEMAAEEKKGKAKAAAVTEADGEPPLGVLWQDVVTLLEGEGIQLASDAVRSLLEQFAANLESDKKHNVTAEQLAATLYRRLEDKLLKNAEVDAFLKKLGVKRERLISEYQQIMRPELTAMLGRFIEALKVLLEEDDDCEVEVLFTAEQLSTVPESAISSIKLRSTLRNYKWNEEQDEVTNQVVRQLLPE
jgi:hypothetical protein